ncbi:MAG: Cys-tRNA(Pro) deacylase [Deltaproteobacteria bacterium]|nr:Cys-tRNA(Pro) deacylase [Deltaproteobacteria bacterium]
MTKEKFPVTNAIRFLKEHQVDFIERPYRYEEKGGTEVAAQALGVDEHLTVKTLVMEDEKRLPLIILMHGDKEVSTRELARVLGVKSITPCSSETAFKHTGYMVGGISPFGTKKQLPVYVEETILNLPRIFINAGRRGLLCEMSPKDMVRVLNPIAVRVAR